MKKIKIGKRYVGGDQPVFIIAEAGVNHNGDEKTALKMVKEAARIGADAVKFQTFITEETVSHRAPFAEHHIANVRNVRSHFELIKKLELPFESFKRIKEYAAELGIIFISTPYDVVSAEYLANIGVPAIKIASAEITNAPLVDTVIGLGLPIILSTGMNNFAELSGVVNIILRRKGDLAILKCTSNYPVDYSNVNLSGIQTLKNNFKDCVIGFSDHSKSYEVACAAVALGAKIIEKHFTLDRGMWGPDHKASLDPASFRAYICAVRNVEKAMGSRDIRVLPSEIMQKKTMQKSIYSRRLIPLGKKISMDDLIFLRPSGGIPPSDYKKIINRKARVDIAEGARLKNIYLSG